MYFEIAGVHVHPLLPPLVAFTISFFTSMGGISGAFLLLPFQVSFLGYTNPSVSATNQLFNIVAIPSGIYRYYKEGRMVWPLAWVVAAGTLPGVLIGAVIRVFYLPNPRNFKLFAAAVLLYIGIKMVRDLLVPPAGNLSRANSEKRFQDLVRQQKTEAGEKQRSPIIVQPFDFKRLKYSFYGESFDVSFWGLFALSFIVGIVGGIYGIGGGAIMAPFFVTYFGLPIYTVAGAALMGTFVTSVAGVAFYQSLALLFPKVAAGPDWLLGVLFGLGGMAGMYCGARCQKYIPAKYIKWMLAVIITLTAARYIAEFLGAGP